LERSEPKLSVLLERLGEWVVTFLWLLVFFLAEFDFWFWACREAGII
jgi:hypothetical protein